MRVGAGVRDTLSQLGFFFAVGPVDPPQDHQQPQNGQKALEGEVFKKGGEYVFF